VLKKDSRNSKGADKRPVTDAEGDLLVELIAQLIETTDLALRNSSAVLDALIAKGVLTEHDVQQAAQGTKRPLSEIHALLDKLRAGAWRDPGAS
jgi:hypothetical protein